MRFSKVSIFILSTSLGAITALPAPNTAPTSRITTSPARRNVPTVSHTKLSKREEPKTADDLPPDVEPKPNNLNKVETAFLDAIELADYVGLFIDTDTTIYPHYFDEVDRAEITRIFASISNGNAGNDYLSKITVQATDTEELCGERTLAYSGDYNTDDPFIVLCPNAFKKKAVAHLEGKEPTDPDAAKFIASCKEDGGDIDKNVSYLMNTLGMTLLHEYMHMDKMIQASFGSIIDDPNKNPGYGPVNVYDRLAKDQARINADSYAYYASHVLWSTICGHDFAAPRPGIDDNDPDCGGTCAT